MKNNQRGLTLVEVLISLCVLLIVFMGLLQASMLTMNVNVRNEVRDEAVRIAADTMTRLRELNYANTDLNATPNNGGGAEMVAFTSAGAPNVFLHDSTLNTVNNPQRSFRNQAVTFAVTKKIKFLPAAGSPPDNKMITVIVRWTFQGTDSTHSIVTTMGNPNA